MLTSDAFKIVVTTALLGFAGTTAAFETSALSAETAPTDAFRLGITSYRAGDAVSAVEALSFAAEKGNTGAQWKLGLMYSEGDGVERNELRAYELLSEVANSGIGDEDLQRQRSTPYILDALVRIGTFFSRGIPNTDVKADLSRARAYFERAALFGNADAQFRLAEMYFDGEGGEQNPLQAARWAKLSMDKGNNDARALLGHLLFQGEGVTRQPTRGLTFLTIAVHMTSPDNGWVRGLHERAMSLAREAEWNQARRNADDWLDANTSRAIAELVPLTQ
ncbi:MAG: tetratricopeptide repeat protein [Alphaproteobacteria bacterium]